MTIDSVTGNPAGKADISTSLVTRWTLCRQAKREIMEIQAFRSGLPLFACRNQRWRGQRSGADKTSGPEAGDSCEFSEAQGRASQRVLAGAFFDQFSVARKHQLEPWKLFDESRNKVRRNPERFTHDMRGVQPIGRHKVHGLKLPVREDAVDDLEAEGEPFHSGKDRCGIRARDGFF